MEKVFCAMKLLILEDADEYGGLSLYDFLVFMEKEPELEICWNETWQNMILDILIDGKFWRQPLV